MQKTSNFINQKPQYTTLNWMGVEVSVWPTRRIMEVIIDAENHTREVWLEHDRKEVLAETQKPKFYYVDAEVYEKRGQKISSFNSPESNISLYGVDSMYESAGIIFSSKRRAIDFARSAYAEYRREKGEHLNRNEVLPIIKLTDWNKQQERTIWVNGKALTNDAKL